MSFKKLLKGVLPGWENRVKEAAYKPPKGLKLTFDYEDLSRETPLRTTQFDFSGLNDAYIQQKGYSARQYPMRCIFTGNDHDQFATLFETGLLQEGRGKLDHPLYGSFNVVPIGSVVRRNDLVQSANQSIVEVTFSTTLAKIYPDKLGIPSNELLNSVSTFNAAAAQQFADAMELASTVQQASAKASIRSTLQQVSSAMKSVSDQTALARRQFDDTFRLINQGLDVLIGQPLLLARQILDFTQAPARALAGLRNKLDGYLFLLQSMFETADSRSINGGTTKESEAANIRNNQRITDLFSFGAIGGSVISAAENTFGSKPEAQQAAIDINDQLELAILWRDGRQEDIGTIDTGESYQAIQSATATATAYLIELSFNLLPERVLVTDRARTIIDLCAELYGDVDDATLQQLMSTNDFTGSEIKEVPKGRRVVWYS